MKREYRRGEVRCHHTVHSAREVLGTHRHERPYVAVVLSGSYVETGPDGAWMCEAGDLVVHPPFHLHADRMSTRGARVLNFVLPFAAIPSFTVSTYCVVRLRQPERVERTALREAIGELTEAIADGSPRQPAVPLDWCDRMATVLMSGSRSQVRSLAESEGVSAAHASREFRARFGIGPATFRAEQRLRHVLRRLAEGSDSLADIAFEAGYADQPHMSRAIRAATGLSATNVRRLMRNQPR